MGDVTPKRQMPRGQPSNITPRGRLLNELTSPAVVRAHEKIARPDATQSPLPMKSFRRLRRKKYLGPHYKDKKFLEELVFISRKFPLCRFCLREEGNICEHSHPIEADPRAGDKISVRALTACAACNAAERESLRETCAKFGEELRYTHIDGWPDAARKFQARRLATRISARGGRVLAPERAARILKLT